MTLGGPDEKWDDDDGAGGHGEFGVELTSTPNSCEMFWLLLSRVSLPEIQMAAQIDNSDKARLHALLTVTKKVYI